MLAWSGGVTIAIAGRTNYPGAVTNWNTFRTLFGLPTNAPTITIPTTDPGITVPMRIRRLTWMWNGPAPSPKAPTSISSLPRPREFHRRGRPFCPVHRGYPRSDAPIMSMSFSVCEAQSAAEPSPPPCSGSTVPCGPRPPRKVSPSLWRRGTAAPTVATPPTPTALPAKAFSGLASTPYNVAVGGTGFNEGTGSYWAAYADNSTLLRFRPELYSRSGMERERQRVGGLGPPGHRRREVAIYNHKPSWQAALGVPADGYRAVPDVALAAASHDGYILYTNGYQVGTPQPTTTATMWGPSAGFGRHLCSTPPSLD